ncbi:MAG TPA: hypothetical protein VF599_22330 [Pyrinomonadaceae bacterium]|jgi:hypothetical protein
MVYKRVKLIKVVAGGNNARISVQIGKNRRDFSARIINRGDIFGVDLPNKLGLMLRGTPETTKKIVADAKKSYRESLINKRVV